jgi:murein DD-endopeptidase MepM/ murein hydrolase activator NlpD
LTAKHDDTVVYALPYAAGKSYPVSQGFHGSYSHTAGDAFAIDFKMDEGTPVHAARGGVVVGSRDDSSTGGPSKKYEWDANYILIQHDDGTLGHYVHLQKGGNRVKAGDVVKAGDWIGKSGNTGHTTGPHLHFAVFKAANGKSRQTFPIRFNAEGLVAQTLKEGSSYRAL